MRRGWTVSESGLIGFGEFFSLGFEMTEVVTNSKTTTTTTKYFVVKSFDLLSEIAVFTFDRICLNSKP